jgi:ABC-type glycerol-3-phosphate transport system substrate-binding protein
LQAAGLGAGGAALLAACGLPRGGEPAGGPSAAPATVRFKTYFTSEAVRQSYDQAFAAWKEQYPTITLDLEFTNYATFKEQIVAQIVSGTPPDASNLDMEEFLPWAYDGLLLPLDAYMKQARISADEFYGGAEFQRIQGKYYALPSTGYTTVLYYNRDLFQKSGVRLPPHDGSWRWKDLQEAAIRLTRRDPANPQQSQWGLLVGHALNYEFPSAVWQNGGNVTERRESPTRTTLDEPAAVAALEWLVDLRYKHQVVPLPDDEKALGGHPFVLGKVGMFWASAGLFATTMTQVQDFWWDVAPGPRGPSGGQASCAAQNQFAGYKATRHPEATLQAVYFFTGGTGQRLRAELTSLLPAHKRILQEVWLKAPPAVNRQAVIDSYPYTRALWKGRQFGKWFSVVQRILNEARDRKLSVADAAREAARQGTAILSAGPGG